MNTSTSKSPQAAAGAGLAPPRLARAAKTIGGILSFSSLALGSAQFYKVSSARLGPGAFMLSIPKILGGSLAPFLAVAGAAGAACGLSALWLQRGKVPRSAGAPLDVLAGLTGALLNAVHTQRVVASRGNFAEAFGADWQEQIPPELKGRMLWVYDRTESLLVTVLMHASLIVSTTPILLPAMTGVAFLTWFLVLTVALWVVVAAIAVANLGGVLSSLLYLIGIDVIAALRYPDYHNYADQMVSE